MLIGSILSLNNQKTQITVGKFNFSPPQKIYIYIMYTYIYIYLNLQGSEIWSF